MKYILYDILFHGFFVATLPYVIYKAITTEKYRDGIGERFGHFKREKLAHLAGNGPGVWIHAVSVGETKAAMPLLKAIREARPEARILFSTTTRTGQAVARSEGQACIDALVYLPLDFSWAVKNIINEFNPSIFIVVEKEVWPNLYKTLNERSVPIVVVNGVISERSYGRFMRFRFFFGQIFSTIGFYCASSPSDMKRAVALGVKKDHAIVTGNLKFDQKPAGKCAITKGLKTALGLVTGEILFVAGSTHGGEEEVILSAFKEALKEHPGLRLAIAPRHPERFAEVEGLIKKSGLSYKKRSSKGRASKGIKKSEVFLLDTMGELLCLYELAHITFVGGSLVPDIGGHNLLEPAGLGRPVLFGPYVHTAAAMAELLREAHGGVMVRDGRELSKKLKELSADDAARKTMGDAAHKVVEDNRGALDKTLKIIQGFLS
jgi:3-deoxy-D-manno-octulosonic-acid transferase